MGETRFPAARVGDQTAHGTPLASSVPPGGSLDVLIGGQPAWRAGDVHVCPLTSGTVPHVGGSVVPGCLTVLINSMPATRATDKIVESGPPNTISAGCTTVLIGD
jgi:uncharacterized Zn-binding protein involved in type VI secretion